MSSFTNFSVHARIRVDERLSMSEEDVALLLDHGLAVKIFEEKNTNRIHLLFYRFLTVLDTLSATSFLYEILLVVVISLVNLE